MVSVLSLGLLYSQVCNFICAVSSCSEPASVRKVAKEPAPSCHEEQPSQQEKQPSGDTHKCPAHDPAVLFLQAGAISTALLHQPVPLSTAMPVPLYNFAFNLALSKTDQGSHFRSPPRRPQLTILRI
jgi:hypothetical protein